jgi:pimeloyl-ACP methyl ester carboxylesterase
VIRRDASFAHAYVRQDLTRYLQIVAGMRDALFDCDTAPGASTDALLQLDVPALVVPGHDKTHATSAARYLEECLPRAEYWDMPVAGQTEATAPPALLDFLGRHPA